MHSVQIKQARRAISLFSVLMLSAVALTSCADVKAPGTRDVNIPAPQNAEGRRAGVNEVPDAITYLPLGDDVLIPEAEGGTPLPSTIVGPFELRSETVAGALQLALDGVDIPIAFETTTGLNSTVTITNLQGPLDRVVAQICGLANLYCAYQGGALVVKDTEIFTVTVPPIAATADMAPVLTNIATAVGNIVGGTAPITDPTTRTIVYRASQRTADVAERYFQRLRTSTSLIVFETYIWEVSLDAGNTTGIRWQLFDRLGKFNIGVNLPGAANPLLGTPISIGLPTTGAVNFDTGDVLQFISTYGAVKTISQPQLTVLSGSSARLRVADTQNYVASISRTTTDGGNTTVSTSTDSVDSGFTLQIASSWDNASVYSNINILLQEVRGIDTFDDNPDAVVQLPQTTERELQTQVRVRPGDSLLIAGLVRETDNFNKSGPGLNQPIIPSSRSAQTSNSELVFLLRPRVVVFTNDRAGAKRPGTVPQAAPVAAPVTADVPAEISTPALTPEVVPEVTPVVPQPPVVEMAPIASEPAYVPPAQPAPVSSPVPAPAPVSAPMPLQEPASLPVPSKAPAAQVYTPAPVPVAPPKPAPVPAPVATAPPVTPQKPASAEADPSVIIDYNMLQGR